MRRQHDTQVKPRWDMRRFERWHCVTVDPETLALMHENHTFVTKPAPQIERVHIDLPENAQDGATLVTEEGPCSGTARCDFGSVGSAERVGASLDSKTMLGRMLPWLPAYDRRDALVVWTLLRMLSDSQADQHLDKEKELQLRNFRTNSVFLFRSRR